MLFLGGTQSRDRRGALGADFKMRHGWLAVDLVEFVCYVIGCRLVGQVIRRLISVGHECSQQRLVIGARLLLLVAEYGATCTLGDVSVYDEKRVGGKRPTPVFRQLLFGWVLVHNRQGTRAVPLEYMNDKMLSSAKYLFQRVLGDQSLSLRASRSRALRRRLMTCWRVAPRY